MNLNTFELRCHCQLLEYPTMPLRQGFYVMPIAIVTKHFTSKIRKEYIQLNFLKTVYSLLYMLHELIPEMTREKAPEKRIMSKKLLRCFTMIPRKRLNEMAAKHSPGP